MLTSEDRAEIQAAAESAVECAWCDDPAVGYASVEPGFAEDHPSCGVHGSGFHGSVEFQFIRPEKALALLAELTRIEQALGREGLEVEMWRHQPVLSMEDGSIRGCQCSDNVFLAHTEDWGTHLADQVRTHVLGDNEGKTTL